MVPGPDHFYGIITFGKTHVEARIIRQERPCPHKNRIAHRTEFMVPCIRDRHRNLERQMFPGGIGAAHKTVLRNGGLQFDKRTLATHKIIIRFKEPFHAGKDFSPFGFARLTTIYIQILQFKQSAFRRRVTVREPFDTCRNAGVQALMDFYPRRLENGTGLAMNNGVRVRMRKKNFFDSGFDNGLGTRRRPSIMAARFESHKDRRPLSKFSGIAQSHDFGMRASRALRTTLAHNEAIFYDNGAHRRIRAAHTYRKKSLL